MGCQHDVMVRMRTARHNAAARLVMAAVRDGTVGGGIISMDIGSDQHRQEDGLDEAPSRGLPQHLAEAMQVTATSRPDAIIEAHSPNDPCAKRYLLVEFKFCADTRHTEQLLQARKQHAALVQQLNRQNDWHTTHH